MTHLRLDLGESLGIVAEVLWRWMATASASAAAAAAAAAVRIAERFHRRRDRTIVFAGDAEGVGDDDGRGARSNDGGSRRRRHPVVEGDDGTARGGECGHVRAGGECGHRRADANRAGWHRTDGAATLLLVFSWAGREMTLV